jgi:XisH protein
MPKKDTFHETVKTALQKANWKITDDPLFVPTKSNINFFIDLGIEKVIGAEKDGQRIAVEIKSFDDESAFYSFYEILGQYLIYEMALEEQKRQFELYIALSTEGYEKLDNAPIFKRAIQKYRLKFIIFEAISQTIMEWKK